MALSLQKFREIVFQFLYSKNFTSSDGLELSLVMRQNTVPKKTAKAALEKAESIWQNQNDLDTWIIKQSHAYEIERIPFAIKAVLRLGIYELLYEKIAPKIAISEAIRLTRKYATAEGATFVNALLDGIYKEYELSEKSISE